jgi:hypothetical protein
MNVAKEWLEEADLPSPGTGREQRLAKSRRRAWRKSPLRDRVRSACQDETAFGAWARSELAMEACQEPTDAEQAREKGDILLWIWASLDEAAIDFMEAALGRDQAWARLKEAKGMARRPDEFLELYRAELASIKSSRGQWARELWSQAGLSRGAERGDGGWSRGWDERLEALRAGREARALRRQAVDAEAAPRKAARL